MLWVSLSAVTAARGPGEYCRHGRSGRPKNPHAPRTHKTTPTHRLRRAARPSEHLRNDDELLFLTLFLSLSSSPHVFHSSFVRYVCRVTAATEYMKLQLFRIMYIIHCVFRASALHAFGKQVASCGAPQKHGTRDPTENHRESRASRIGRRKRRLYNLYNIIISYYVVYK